MKKPLYPFLSIFTLLLILGCHTENKTKVCSPPSSMASDQSCFKLEMGLEVNAEGFQSASGSWWFRWGYYPQQDVSAIDLSLTNEQYASAGGSRFIIPGKEIEGVSRFAVEAKMFCNGEAVGSLYYVFDIKTEGAGCQVWVGAKL